MIFHQAFTLNPFQENTYVIWDDFQYRIITRIDSHVRFQIHRTQTIKKSLFDAVINQIFFEFRSYCDSLQQKS